MYLADPGIPDQSDDLRKRVSQRLGHLSKMCDVPPFLSMQTVSTCVPEDFEVFSSVSSTGYPSPSPGPCHDCIQITSPPSSILRSMSSPSLGISLESPLRPASKPSLRDVSHLLTPPRNQAFLRQRLDPSGSPSAEQKCRAAAAKQSERAASAAAKLGAASPYVECLRTQAIDLRKRADHLKWNRLVFYHDRNVSGALFEVESGADVMELEDAVTLARNSALGPGHRIILDGKRNILRIRKQRRLEDLARVEDEQEQQLQAATNFGDRRILASVIDEAVRTIGSAHPAVEAARSAMKGQRQLVQRSRWHSSVEEHRVLMLEACATNDIEQIAARIRTTATSELGVGNSIVEHGKNRIRDLKQHADSVQLDLYRQECLLMLNDGEVHDAIPASESGQCP